MTDPEYMAPEHDRESADELQKLLDEKRRELPTETAPAPMRDVAELAGFDFEKAFSGQPRCIDCGLVDVPRFGRSCAACDRARMQREHVEALKSAWLTVPETLRDRGFAELAKSKWCTDREAIVAAHAMATTKRPLVTLVGQAGAGKTTLAVCMLREAMRAGARHSAPRADQLFAQRARFVVALDLLEAASGHRRGRGRVFDVDVAHDASILVLDELGGGRTQDPDGVVYSLIHERHRERRPTIITTGVSREQLAAMYGGGIERRVFDDATVIHVRKETRA